MSTLAHVEQRPQVEAPKAAAAFYDLDGTLCSSNIVHAYSFYARTQPTLLRSVLSTASLVASVPFFIAADAYSRKVFNELFYRRYKGMREDRLRLFAEDLFEQVVRPTIFQQAHAMVRQSRAAGYRQVLVTGALDLLAAPVAQYLGMDHWVANELEVVDGYCTGKIRHPLLAGPSKAAWIRRYTADNGLDLDQCFAYADSMSDFPMLAVVGKPAVINPDRRLKLQAKSFDWPILRFE